jgi:Kef-type K+ transport system membrane component KefB
MHDIFIYISLIMLVALGLSIIFKLLKQPLIIAYIFTGIILVPFLLDMGNVPIESIKASSEIGVALLLFIVGINLDIKMLKSLGKNSIILGLIQMILTAGVVALCLFLLEFDLITTLYIAVALSFSATVIIFKILSDRGEMQKLYSKVTIGISLFQDAVSALALLIASSFATTGGEAIYISIIKWFVLIASLYVSGMYILPKFLEKLAKSQELIFTFAIAWCFTVAMIFSLAGLGVELGALLAGVSLSSTMFQSQISARIKPLRDFFLIIYFVFLGLQINFQVVMEMFPIIIILTVVATLGKIISSYLGCRLMGYDKKIAFLTGNALTPLSEFSFILMALGVSLGHIAPEFLVMVTAVGIFSITISSYLITYGNSLYYFIFKGKEIKEKMNIQDTEIYLFGYNRVGYDLLRSFNKFNMKHAIVDYDPEIVKELKGKGETAIYGDATDYNFLENLNWTSTKLIVSTIPYVEANMNILDYLHKTKQKEIFITTAHKIDDALLLYDLGADYVIMPHFLGGIHAAEILQVLGTKQKDYDELREDHIKELLLKKKMGHEHPTLDFKI